MYLEHKQAFIEEKMYDHNFLIQEYLKTGNAGDYIRKVSDWAGGALLY